MTKRRSAPLTTAQRREAARAAAAKLRQDEATRRRRTWILSIVTAVVVIGGIVGAAIAINNSKKSDSSSSAPGSDTSSKVLAGTSKGATGKTVDGISSAPSEQLAFHVHSHLAIYVNGVEKNVPYGIGIVPPLTLDNSGGSPFATGGKAIYWLHTHDETGIIHMEAPKQITFTLKNFFDIWGQPISATQVGPAKGSVIAYVNGKKVTGDPAEIKLAAHEVIQLDVGKDVAPKPYTFPSGV